VTHGIKERYSLKNETLDEYLLIKAIITSNETLAPNITINYEPVLWQSLVTLTGPEDYSNLNFLVLSSTIATVALILFLSILVMKLVKFGRKGEELDGDGHSERSRSRKPSVVQRSSNLNADNGV
jgi:hypothetical protein